MVPVHGYGVVIPLDVLHERLANYVEEPVEEDLDEEEIEDDIIDWLHTYNESWIQGIQYELLPNNEVFVGRIVRIDYPEEPMDFPLDQRFADLAITELIGLQPDFVDFEIEE